MIQVSKTNIARYGIRLYYLSIFIGMGINLGLILENPVCNIAIETTDFTTFFITDDIVTVERTCVDRRIST